MSCEEDSDSLMDKDEPFYPNGGTFYQEIDEQVNAGWDDIDEDINASSEHSDNSLEQKQIRDVLQDEIIDHENRLQRFHQANLIDDVLQSYFEYKLVPPGTSLILCETILHFLTTSRQDYISPSFKREVFNVLSEGFLKFSSPLSEADWLSSIILKFLHCEEIPSSPSILITADFLPTPEPLYFPDDSIGTQKISTEHTSLFGQFDSWNSKGFGYISSEALEESIFCHISEIDLDGDFPITYMPVNCEFDICMVMHKGEVRYQAGNVSLYHDDITASDEVKKDIEECCGSEEEEIDDENVIQEEKMIPEDKMNDEEESPCLHQGDFVKVLYDDGIWYNGIIIGFECDNTVSISFEGFDEIDIIDLKWVKLREESAI